MLSDAALMEELPAVETLNALLKESVETELVGGALEGTLYEDIDTVIYVSTTPAPTSYQTTKAKTQSHLVALHQQPAESSSLPPQSFSNTGMSLLRVESREQRLSYL
jgi:hypothetical protein